MNALLGLRKAAMARKALEERSDVLVEEEQRRSAGATRLREHCVRVGCSDILTPLKAGVPGLLFERNKWTTPALLEGRRLCPLTGRRRCDEREEAGYYGPALLLWGCYLVGPSSARSVMHRQLSLQGPSIEIWMPALNFVILVGDCRAAH